MRFSFLVGVLLLVATITGCGGKLEVYDYPFGKFAGLESGPPMFRKVYFNHATFQIDTTPGGLAVTFDNGRCWPIKGIPSAYFKEAGVKARSVLPVGDYETGPDTLVYYTGATYFAYEQGRLAYIAVRASRGPPESPMFSKGCGGDGSKFPMSGRDVKAIFGKPETTHSDRGLF